MRHLTVMVEQGLKYNQSHHWGCPAMKTTNLMHRRPPTREHMPHCPHGAKCIKRRIPCQAHALMLLHRESLLPFLVSVNHRAALSLKRLPVPCTCANLYHRNAAIVSWIHDQPLTPSGQQTAMSSVKNLYSQKMPCLSSLVLHLAWINSQLSPHEINKSRKLLHMQEIRT